VRRPAEISDLIVRFDPDTLDQLPVSKAAVLAALASTGDRQAMRIVHRIPERDGHLDRDFVKHLLIDVHYEIQRLSEEFQHGHRMLAILRPLLAAIPASVERPLRVVDVGCGTGYIVRWLARFGALGPDVELVGVDINEDLVEQATYLGVAGVAVGALRARRRAARRPRRGDIHLDRGSAPLRA
jgi:2-polyprenyl-3-methyl-5-hydroxy-6-metoxy-1,4-benzoquinol methylase